MKKLAMICLIPLFMVACGSKKSNPAPGSDTGLFAVTKSQVTNFNSLEGLWESNKVFNNSDSITVRMEIRATSVSATSNCTYRGQDYYVSTSVPAVKLNNGNIRTTTGDQKQIDFPNGDYCRVTIRQRTFRRSDNNGGIMFNGGTVFTKVGN